MTAPAASFVEQVFEHGLGASPTAACPRRSSTGRSASASTRCSTAPSYTPFRLADARRGHVRRRAGAVHEPDGRAPGCPRARRADRARRGRVAELRPRARRARRRDAIDGFAERVRRAVGELAPGRQGVRRGGHVPRRRRRRGGTRRGGARVLAVATDEAAADAVAASLGDAGFALAADLTTADGVDALGARRSRSCSAASTARSCRCTGAGTARRGRRGRRRRMASCMRPPRRGSRARRARARAAARGRRGDRARGAAGGRRRHRRAAAGAPRSPTRSTRRSGEARVLLERRRRSRRPPRSAHRLTSGRAGERAASGGLRHGIPTVDGDDGPVHRVAPGAARSAHTSPTSRGRTSRPVGTASATRSGASPSSGPTATTFTRIPLWRELHRRDLPDRGQERAGDGGGAASAGRAHRMGGDEHEDTSSDLALGHGRGCPPDREERGPEGRDRVLPVGPLTSTTSVPTGRSTPTTARSAGSPGSWPAAARPSFTPAARRSDRPSTEKRISTSPPRSLHRRGGTHR